MMWGFNKIWAIKCGVLWWKNKARNNIDFWISFRILLYAELSKQQKRRKFYFIFLSIASDVHYAPLLHKHSILYSFNLILYSLRTVHLTRNKMLASYRCGYNCQQVYHYIHLIHWSDKFRYIGRWTFIKS